MDLEKDLNELELNASLKLSELLVRHAGLKFLTQEEVEDAEFGKMFEFRNSMTGGVFDFHIKEISKNSEIIGVSPESITLLEPVTLEQLSLAEKIDIIKEIIEFTTKPHIVPLFWETDGADAPKFISLKIDEIQIEQFKKLSKIVESEKGVDYIAVDFPANYFNDIKCTEKSEFRSDVHQIRVFNGFVRFFAQSKFDSATQFESEAISLYFGK